MIGKANNRKSITGRFSRRCMLLTVVSVLALCAFGLTACQKKEPARVIVGWQTAWATAGQIFETMVHTNIPKLHGSNATFKNFLFGPDQLEAAMGGNIDVVTAGVVPIVNLLAASNDWVVVSRLIDFSVSTIARTGSGVKTFADLKGKKLGVPFGSGAHPYIVQRLQENNLKIGTGPDAVELVNVSPAESAQILQQGGVDAVGTWEPNATIMESKGLGKSIDDKRYVGFMAVRKSLVEKHPEEVVTLLKSLIEANLYVAKNRDQTDEWFAKRSNMDRGLLKKIRIIEPNLKAQKIEDVSVQITPEDIALSQQVADQMQASGLIKRSVKISDHVNNALAQKASEDTVKVGSKLKSIIKVEQK